MQYLYNGSPVPTPVKASDLVVVFPELIAQFDRQIAEQVQAEHETLCESLESLGFLAEGPEVSRDHLVSDRAILEGSKIVFSDEDAALVEGALG